MRNSSISLQNNTHIDSIDGMRALGALLVIAYHFDVDDLRNGYLGVDIFFVISGFLITRNLMREHSKYGNLDFRAFFKRRVFRLFPALAITVAISLVAGVFMFPADSLVSLAKEAITSLFYVSNIHFWLESGYFDKDAILKPLLHTWSLSVEEQFYLFWPFLVATLLLFLRTKRAMAVAFLAIFIASIMLNFAFQRLESATFFLFFFRIFQFSAGALFGMLVFQPDSKSSEKWLLTAMIIAILLIVSSLSIRVEEPILFFEKETVTFIAHGLSITLGSALLLLASMGKGMRAVFGFLPIVLIGRISYSLYLVHWPLVVFYKYWKFDDLNWGDQLLLAIVTLILGSCLYLTVERHFRIR